MSAPPLDPRRAFLAKLTRGGALAAGIAVGVLAALAIGKQAPEPVFAAGRAAPGDQARAIFQTIQATIQRFISAIIPNFRVCHRVEPSLAICIRRRDGISTWFCLLRRVTAASIDSKLC